MNININTDKKFSLGEIIETAWSKQKERLLFYAWVFAVYQAIAYFLTFFAEKARPQLLTYISFQFATAIILIIMQIGVIKFFLKVVDGGRPELGDIFEGGEHFWRYLGAFVLVGLVAFAVALPAAGLIVLLPTNLATAYLYLPVIGLVVIVALAIYLAVHLIFFPYLVIDQNAGPLTAIKESWKIARGLEWPLVLFLLALAVINIIGVMLLGLGLLISLPLSQLALAYLYRKLQTIAQQDELPVTV